MMEIKRNKISNFSPNYITINCNIYLTFAYNINYIIINKL